uniref:Uncharacterized protein n=1 Tax=Parascaris equorum TaxID=6256 RepID=A0A914R9V1_PAREQ
MNLNFFPLRRINSLLRFAFLLVLTNAFNIDTHAPIFKIGPAGSYFGFSVAEHFNGEQPPCSADFVAVNGTSQLVDIK